MSARPRNHALGMLSIVPGSNLAGDHSCDNPPSYSGIVKQEDKLTFELG